MTERFRDCLRFTLAWEGGFSMHPADPGGATMRGVTQKVYDSYRDRQGLGRQPVQSIRDQELEAIYRTGYWDLCRCESLPAPVDLSVFEAAVNCGPGRSVKWLQRAAGVEADGIIGPGTLAAVAAQDPQQLAMAHAEFRRQHYLALNGPFLRGWLNRLDALELLINEPFPEHADAGPQMA